MTLSQFKEASDCSASCEPVVDSGAMASNAGVPNVMELAEHMNVEIELKPLRKDQPKHHHFGPQSAGARLQEFLETAFCICLLQKEVHCQPLSAFSEKAPLC